MPNNGIPKEELEHSRDLGAATYLSAYVRLMAKALGIDTDTESVNRMALEMVEPLNIATEATWRALMADHEGRDRALLNFGECLNKL